MNVLETGFAPLAWRNQEKVPSRAEENVLDGALAIVAGVRAMRRGELWQALMFEGAANLMVAGAGSSGRRWLLSPSSA